MNYRKVKLFEGETADGFVAIKETGVFRAGGTDSVSNSDIGVDFDREGWEHSRVAMMRAVENGYSLVRNAQQGSFKEKKKSG